MQGKSRKKAGCAHQAKTQNTPSSSAELAAAVQPEAAAPTSSNSQKNNKVLVQPSDSDSGPVQVTQALPTSSNSMKNDTMLILPSDGGSPDSGAVQVTQALPPSPASDITKPAHAALAADTAQPTAAVQMGAHVADAGRVRPTTNGSVASALHHGTADASGIGANASAAMQKSDSSAAGLTAQDLAAVSTARATARQGRKRAGDDSIQAESDTHVKKAKGGANGNALHQSPGDHHDAASLRAEPMQLDHAIGCNHNTRRIVRHRAQMYM